MKTFEEASKFLESKIPRSEIYIREGARGTSLSYFTYWWTNDLLNQCFGNMGWSSETTSPILVSEEANDKGKLVCTYQARTVLKAMVRGPEAGTILTVTHDGIGTCSGEDREMAIKGAESDGFKRAAVKFGKRLGLALYDKSEEFIHDDKKQDGPAAAQPAGIKPQGPQTSKGSPVPNQNANPIKVEAKASLSTPSAPTREAINSLIRSTASVAFSKKVLVEGEPWTLDRMKALLTSYGVSQTEELTDTQANDILDFLKSIIL